MYHNKRLMAAVVFATALIGTQLTGTAANANPTVINLTQVACQFLESENGIDHGYTTTKKADCEAINARTGNKRLAKANVLQLKPGKYIFRVKNENVSYELGFWLRGAGLINSVILPSVSGGGLIKGKTQDYEINLKPGKYLYSCPLNTTPDYKLVVKD